jgi:hypothetical protein
MLHRRYILRKNHHLNLHRHYFLKPLCLPLYKSEHPRNEINIIFDHGNRGGGYDFCTKLKMPEASSTDMLGAK